METINKAPASSTTAEQGTSAGQERKGGFVQGVAVAQGCCGEASSGSGGCCGTSAQAAIPATTIEPTAQGGCCGAAASQAKSKPAAGSCC